MSADDATFHRLDFMGLPRLWTSPPAQSARGEWNCWLWTEGLGAPVILDIHGPEIRTHDGRPKANPSVEEVAIAHLRALLLHVERTHEANTRRRRWRAARPERQITRRDRARRGWRTAA